MERNLFAKRFIKGILYSKKNLKITLFYSENSKELKISGWKTMTALLSQGSSQFSKKIDKNSIPIKGNQFVSNIMAAGIEKR